MRAEQLTAGRAAGVDGNTHAGEVTGCEACLHFLYTLLSDYAAGDPSTLEMLRTSTIYVVPKVSPDGAELYLTSAYSLRASPILWPNAASPPVPDPEPAPVPPPTSVVAAAFSTSYSESRTCFV